MNFWLEYKWAYVVDTNVDIIECINLFDEGYSQIYVVNEAMQFGGMVIKRDRFKYMWQAADLSDWVEYLTEEDCLINTQGMFEEEEQVKKLAQEHPDLEEIPVVRDGVITGVYCKKRQQPCTALKYIVFPQLRRWSNQYERICISSLKSPIYQSIYQKLINVGKVTVLNDDNLNDVLEGKYDLFLCGEDVYPETLNKVSITEFEKLLEQEFRSHFLRLFGKRSSIPTIEESKFNLFSCIQKFDEEYESVYIVGPTGRFRYTVSAKEFKKDFPWNMIQKWSAPYIEKGEDDEETFRNIMEAYQSFGRKELPIVKNGMIDENTFFNSRLEAESKIVLDWDRIPKEAVISYFKGQTILLSSVGGRLGEFYKRYKECLSIDLLKDQPTFRRLLAGQYDHCIVGSDIWPAMESIKNIKLLYLELLGREVEKQMKEKQVTYLYYEVPRNTEEVVAFDTRYSSAALATGFATDYYGLEEKKDECCYITYPEYDQEGFCVKDGRRKTVPEVEGRENAVYFYGPCTNVGFYSKDEETIQSHLQQILESDGELSYQVFNAGGMIGSSLISDINTMYLMLEEEVKPGDIIVQLGYNMRKRKLRKQEYSYSFLDIYNSEENMDKKIFVDWSGHLDSLGNQLVAENIYGTIQTIKKRETRS